MRRSDAERLWGHLFWLAILEEQGSYTAAAARLGVSKAAVSQRIAELERATGLALVRRTTRSMSLTEVGSRLVEDVRQGYDRIAEGLADAVDSSQEPQGLVRLSAPVAFTRQQLVPRLPVFLKENPKVKLRLDVTDHIVSLTSEGYDLAVRHSIQVPDTHVALKLCDTRTVLVASARYLDEYGVPDHPADLVGHNCLYYSRGLLGADWIFDGVEAGSGKTIDVRVSGSLSINNSESLRDAAVAGLGIAQLPDFSALASLEEGTLIQVLPKWRLRGPFANQIYLVRPYASQVPKAVQALTDFFVRNSNRVLVVDIGFL